MAWIKDRALESDLIKQTLRIHIELTRLQRRTSCPDRIELTYAALALILR